MLFTAGVALTYDHCPTDGDLPSPAVSSDYTEMLYHSSP